MEKVGIIDLEQRLFDIGHVDFPGNHLLQDAAVGQITLQEVPPPKGKAVADFMVAFNLI